MAEDFAIALYDLIAGWDPDPAEFHSFKAEGDQSRIFADLGSIDPDDQSDMFADIVDLLKRYGVPEPPGNAPQPIAMSKSIIVYRDFSVGELKSILSNCAWPQDAFTVETAGPIPPIVSLGYILAGVIIIAVVIAVLAGKFDGDMN